MKIMDRSRALEIIASYGADSLRWPMQERAALLDLARSDAGVQAAIATAEPLDGALRIWATQGVTNGSADAAALDALVAVTTKPRWWGGVAVVGAIAASVALAVVVLPPAQSVGVTPVPTQNPATTIILPTKSVPAMQRLAVGTTQPEPMAAISDADADEAVYAMMFTETPEEELYL